MPFWKNIASIMWLAMQYANSFEGFQQIGMNIDGYIILILIKT